MSGVLTARRDANEVNIPRKSCLRYLGYGNTPPEETVSIALEDAITQFESVVDYKACYLKVSIKVEEETVDFGFASIHSKNLAKNLFGCHEAILFAATTGTKVEMARRQAEVLSSSRALLFDAVGTAAIEQFCDMLCTDWAHDVSPQHLRPRFSPGYGDLPLEFQKTLLQAVDANRKIGLSLTEALLMTPQKSVSAIVGIADTGCTTVLHNCDECKKKRLPISP